MSLQPIKRPTKKKRGRPRKPGKSRKITIRLRDGEHDTIIQRLQALPRGKWSSYIRRVLDGAPVEALDQALQQESEGLTSALDGMWDDDWGDDQ